jgi:superfamily II DNA/RNA helicase
MSQAYMNNPERVAVGSTFNPADKIEQKVLRITDGEKGDVLLEELELRAGSIIIFVKTKYGTERMAKRLNGQGYDSQAIHGDMKQSRRERVIKAFRDMKFQILVATDVVARGLDIPHIEHVINYDLPQVLEDYIHRIGRTARAGATGQSLALVTPTEERKWHDIELLMNPEMKPRYAPEKGKGRGGRGKSTRGGKAYFKDKPRSKKSKAKKSSKKHVLNPNANPNRNHKWDGTPRIVGEDKPKSKKTDRGYREEKDTNKKSPFKKTVSKKSKSQKVKRKKTISSGDKPLSRKKPNDKSKTRNPKSGIQKGKKVYAGGKAKRNAAKRDARKARNKR